MAKISARGASKLFDVDVTLKGSDTQYRFTVCSDGRVLSQYRDMDGKLTSHTLWRRLGNTKGVTREYFLTLLTERGYQV